MNQIITIRKKHILSVLLTTMLCVTLLSTNTYASDSKYDGPFIIRSDTVSLSFESLSEEEERAYSSDTGLVASLLSVLIRRNNEFGCSTSVSQLPNHYADQIVLFAPTVITDSTSRTNAINNMETRIGADFVQSVLSLEICSIDLQDNVYTVCAIEKTEVTYRYLNSEEDDSFGFCTDHEIAIRKNSSNYTIISDSFDETLITGAISSDRVLRGEDNEEYLSAESSQSFSPVIASTGISGYNATDAIIYSNVWWNSYNSSYYHSSDGSNDCANYVSQCIENGGISQDTTWFADSYGYSTAWCRAWTFDGYWVGRGVTKLNVLTYGGGMYSCIPGNPVYWLNGANASPSGHIMIHVGYNTAKVPVVNGHSPCMHKVPITNFSDHSLKTLTIKACSHSSYSTFTYSGQTYGLCNSCGAIFIPVY